MTLLSALLAGLLFGCGCYLTMRRTVIDVLLGTIIVSQSTFVMLIALSGWQRGTRPPIIVDEGTKTKLADGTVATLAAYDPTPYVDPIPQALLLTAIVISFGVTAFLVTLIARGYEYANDPELGELPDDEGSAH